MTTSNIRTRYAPSPTGPLHVGGVRTALFNYLFAKKHGGEFLLRIEDTDSKRFDRDAESHIKESLRWLGIIPDMSPWEDLSSKKQGFNPSLMRQSARAVNGMYVSAIEQLLKDGHAYVAFDTEDELTAARERWNAAGHKGGYNHKTRSEMSNSLNPNFCATVGELTAKMSTIPHVIRWMNVPGKTVVIDDLVKGTVTFSSDDMDDKVLVKKDRVPTYHLANVCDDHDMEITHVIRGDEWLSSASLHMMLYEALGWTPPKFAHLPLVWNPDGKSKLSKRAALKLGFTVFAVGYKGMDEGELVDIPGFRELGYEPEALVNFLALLGWNSGTEKEKFTMAELIDAFSLDRINNSGARFDILKLNAFNFAAVQNLPPSEIVPANLFSKFDHADYMQVVEWTKERSPFRKDTPATYMPFIKAPESYLLDGKNPLTPEAESVWLAVCDEAEKSDLPWTRPNIETLILAVCAVKDVKKGSIMPFLRTALTGGHPGPDLIGTMAILGKRNSLDRIRTAVAEITIINKKGTGWKALSS